MPTAPQPEQRSIRGQVFNTAFDLLGGNTDDQAKRARAARLAESFGAMGRTVADFTPVIGDALAVGDARDAFNRGDYGQASILGGLAAVGMVPVVGDLAKKGGDIAMDTASRMGRAADQGYTERLMHSSNEVFAGSPQAKEAAEYGLPIRGEFEKTYGGTYFAPEGSLAEDIFSSNPFGGSAEYLINKGKNFNANFKSMSKGQNQELMDIKGSD